jgi:Spy/CpxP family protein refolding chaperone
MKPRLSPESPRRRGVLFALAAAPVLGASLFALASPASADPAHDGGRGGWGARMCDKLECTESQRTKLGEIFAELRKDSRADREAIAGLRAQMAEEFAKAKPDEKRLRRLASQVSKLHADLGTRRLDAMLQAHSVLDAKQRAKLVEMMEHRRGKGRSGKGGPRGGNKK